MPKKKLLTDAEISKLRDIDAYEHLGKKRSNNPPIGLAKHDRVAEEMTHYEFDPHIDPTLSWSGKTEGASFDVPASSIHIHESIKPSKILRAVQSIGDEEQTEEMQLSLFESPLERMRRRQSALEFYKHGVDWTNRLIAGDSLVIMNSLLQKEGMAGQVQMVYFDPPYGIKYGSNFQPFINDTSLKSTDKDEDLTQEPEMIKAFRDTWQLGIHSYLTYLRNRLLLTRDLLTESGSVFIQISDENIHYVRNICDEIFGPENFVSQITIKKASTIFQKKLLNNANYYVVWYAKNKEKIKYHNLFIPKDFQGFANTVSSHLWAENKTTGETIKPTPEERKDIVKFLNQHPGFELYRLSSLNAQGTDKTQGYEYEGRTFYPPRGTQWKTSYPDGLNKLRDSNRLQIEGDYLSGKIYYNDYPVMTLTNLWDKIGAPNNKIYVVQTTTEVIKRCMLMTTDPSDLVLDITCGSGTTAYTAEYFGRRWITCDTSRVAIELAKQRLMTSVYPYFTLMYPDQGVASGFVYKTAQHITLGSITNDEPSATETLYDQPEIDKTKVRISGPFTVEALPAPVVKPLDDTSAPTPVYSDDLTAKQANWRDELLATGILAKNGSKLEFSRVEPLSGTVYLQAEAETKEEQPKRAVICFGSETKIMDARMVEMALNEAEELRPKPNYIIFAAFQFGPEASHILDDTKWAGVTLLKVQMNTDLMTDDLKKNRSSNQSFWLVGQPDVELVKDNRTKDRYKVIVNGFDYYNVKTGKVDSGDEKRISMWMLDTSYDGMNIEPHQVFFPMGGKNGGWKKLAKTLKAEINQELISAYAGNESLWFRVKPNSSIAVKIIDDRGIESLKVLKVGDE